MRFGSLELTRLGSRIHAVIGIQSSCKVSTAINRHGFEYRRIHADVIVYIFAHLHTALRTEGNMLDMN